MGLSVPWEAVVEKIEMGVPSASGIPGSVFGFLLCPKSMSSFQVFQLQILQEQ